jgi:hypothetical protein
MVIQGKDKSVLSEERLLRTPSKAGQIRIFAFRYRATGSFFSFTAHALRFLLLAHFLESLFSLSFRQCGTPSRHGPSRGYLVIVLQRYVVLPSLPH